MASARKQLIVEKPFIYGNATFWLGKAEKDEHSHKWTVFVRGVENEDLSTYIKEVHFVLHTSFENHIRVIKRPPYEVTETGWGEFAIQIIIHFKDESEEPPVTLSHHLKLFNDNKALPQTTKVPVISEKYDEFVFVNPTHKFYNCLMQPPPQVFDSHFLTPFCKCFVRRFICLCILRYPMHDCIVTCKISLIPSFVFCLN
jgi:YEATS domain-containing protein 4